jgi:CheY-like chemotaxis protein
MARIAVVDDNDDLRAVLRFMLEPEGYEVIEARNGAEALELPLTGKDVMLLDVMMPVADGWEVLAGLKKARRTKRPRVIMLTAKAGEKDRQRALSQGAVAFIPKPFDHDEVLRQVAKVAAQTDEGIDELRNHQMYLARLLHQIERAFSPRSPTPAA